MANTPQSRKRARQNKRRWLRNISLRSMYRTYIKRVVTAINNGKVEEAQTAFKTAIPVIDKMVTKGILSKNTASRYKHRLNNRIKAMLESSS